jgi:hypothetical protein
VSLRPQGRTSTAADPFDAEMFAKRNDRYLTPLPLVRALGEFDLDPCGAPGHATARTVWTPEEVGDGLSLPWFGRVWLNPPYGREISVWVDRLFQHGSGIALLPCAPDTALWQRRVLADAAAVLFVRGRIRYENAERPANHASALVAVSSVDAAALTASDLGHVYEPTEREPGT